MAETVAQTERLRLREWDDADEVRFYDLMNTPAVMRWLGGLQTREEWNAAYQRLRAYQRDLGFTFWIVERRSDGEILGLCGLKRANAPGGAAIAARSRSAGGCARTPGARAMPRKRQSPRSTSPSVASPRPGLSP
jgi:RimJ/RimL family protein N-acetyltransferase